MKELKFPKSKQESALVFNPTRQSIVNGLKHAALGPSVHLALLLALPFYHTGVEATST